MREGQRARLRTSSMCGGSPRPCSWVLRRESGAGARRSWGHLQSTWLHPVGVKPCSSQPALGHLRPATPPAPSGVSLWSELLGPPRATFHCGCQTPQVWLFHMAPLCPKPRFPEHPRLQQPLMHRRPSAGELGEGDNSLQKTSQHQALGGSGATALLGLHSCHGPLSVGGHWGQHHGDSWGHCS